jgi:hypothetical protein
MDRMLQSFLFHPKPAGYFGETRQGQKHVLWENSNYKIVQIDYLGNGGGIVFVYLCAAATRLDTSVRPISFTLEATCRGMSCRVEGDLLDHETVAKGKKFEAAWRKYKTNFPGESKSRLLMVLYQSGQDTEMGSITCTMGMTLGGTDSHGTNDFGSTTLHRFWSTSKGIDATTYAEKGLFNQVGIMDMDTFRRCGQNHGGNSLTMRQYDSFEDDNLPEVIEMSRQKQHGIDADLEEALRRSRQDVVVKGDENSKIIASVTNQDDLELQRAIELSMREETGKRTHISRMVDLTDCPSDALSSSPVKKRKTEHEPEMVILMDDDQDVRDDHGQVDPTETAVDDRVTKRKKAAEAALKRMQKQNNST